MLLSLETISESLLRLCDITLSSIIRDQTWRPEYLRGHYKMVMNSSHLTICLPGVPIEPLTSALETERPNM